MATSHLSLHRRSWLACALALLAACDGNSGGDAPAARSALSVACVDEADLPPEAWVCPDGRTLECGEVDDATLYVVETEGVTCAGETLIVSGSGPFPPGTHVITVDDADGEVECTSELTVVDSAAPVLVPQTIELWPPNHKFHDVSVADCVAATDTCDGDLTAEFIWASSDEPVDDIGDGHHAPDIVLDDDCQRVSLRSERQGPRDGRVDRLGVRVTDSAGNGALGDCAVIVDHDQRGVTGADSGEAYRIVFDGSDGGPVCDGVTEPPPDDDAGIDEDGGAGEAGNGGGEPLAGSAGEAI